MTKYYFISYMCQTAAGIMYASCLYKAENKALHEITGDIAEYNKTTPKSIVIICLKDLSEEEYEMLKGEENENIK